MAEATADQPRAVRRKFAMPPVKLACLSCRASRTRCDGGQPCASCVSKNNDCVYRPSRRGGPRIRKKAVPSPPVQVTQESPGSDVSLNIPVILPPPIEIQNFVDAGAALGQLPELPPDSDFIFDNLFLNTFPEVTFNDTTLPAAFPIASVPEKSGPLVRTYRSNASLLQAYYCWIHLFVPILPAPETAPPVDQPVAVSQNQPDGFSSGLDFTSPVALALSAVLALVPCAEDTDPMSTESVLFRRNCAQFFAQAAIESIEAEAEIPASSTEPEKMLESTPPSLDRTPFHPHVPVELESIVALNFLSIYEYAQRGNLKKMRSRAGQALVEAMMTYGLHKLPDDDDFYAEAKRRIWWMTYLQATQTAIVSCTTPPLELFGVSFTTKYPTLEVDPEAWQLLIETQQALLATTSFIVDLNEAITNKMDMEPIYRKIAELEATIAPLVERCDAWPVSGPLAPIVDPSEACLMRSLRCMARTRANSARIKLHRFVAFGDYPVFAGKMCDLQGMVDVPADTGDTMSWLPCMCGIGNGNGSGNGGGNGVKSDSPESQMLSMTAAGSSPCSGTPETVNSMATTPATSAHLEACRKAPFSSHWSAKVCLRSALNIANDFDNMPYPNPSGQLGQNLCFLSPTSTVVAPRMLPSYVCCAMQGAYVFLSIYRKTSLLSPGAASSSYLLSMLMQLQQGLLSILGAIENYSTAFEAMQAMRDQVRKSAEGLITLQT